MSKSVNVAKLAKLTNIPVSDNEVAKFSSQFQATLVTVQKLEELDTTSVEATPQVTGLSNIFREDEINQSRMFSQKEALVNAKHVHNGYFVVEAVINET